MPAAKVPRLDTPWYDRPMKPTVYLETTIISYLTGRISRDLVVAAQQQVTRDWWERRRSDFTLYVSDIVLDEAGAGDSDAASRRLEAVGGLESLDADLRAEQLTQALLKGRALPAEAGADAAHMAIAAVHQIQYLLTWNCRHIHNAEMLPVVQLVCEKAGFRCPIICTPQELMGEE